MIYTKRHHHHHHFSFLFSSTDVINMLSLCKNLVWWKRSTNTILETKIQTDQLTQDNTENLPAPAMN